MYIVFYRTTDVFEAEEQLTAKGVDVEIAPTPVQDKAYCGVCVQINDTKCDIAKEILAGFDYQIIP